MSGTVDWGGYEFTVYLHDGDWNEVAGLYIFAGQQSDGRWRPIYVGETTSFAQRIPTHEYWSEAVRLGATHVHARVEPEELTRALIEKELIQAFQPELNVQHMD